MQDTTLLIHFFGPKGNAVLRYDDFSRLELNLNGLIVNITSNSEVNNLACTCTSTVKPAHVVTSIKQPPALKGHFLPVLS